MNLKINLSCKSNVRPLRNLVLLLLLIVTAAPVYADLVAVSQLGYHPNSTKQVIIYTNSSTSYTSAELVDANNANIVKTISLLKAKNYGGTNVECQGNAPCYVGDFSDFMVQGSYYFDISGIKSPTFKIDSQIFKDNTPTLLEFFDAMLQQNSAYHGDFHSNYQPSFNAMADGSFIMEADQASLALIRLGSAYRKNPTLFTGIDNYNILSANKPDMQEYILSYVDYLEGLQGLELEELTDGTGFRLNPNVEVQNIFVPGPTNLTNLTVYIPGSSHAILKSDVPVVSLCGNDTGTEWQKCVDDAAFYFKCQIDEPCLNMTYIEKTGKVKSTNNGYAVSRGWGYEFGCYVDVDLNSDMFDSEPNPCMVFYPETSRSYDVYALLGFLESVPAVNDYSSIEGNSLLARSINTYNHIKINDSVFSANDPDAGFFGASLFLLYNYTANASYLLEAHSLKDIVGTNFESDHTRGNEFYWEEYIKNKNNLESRGLPYQVNAKNPEEFFTAKILSDYSDLGADSMSNNGERIFQYNNNIQFQNSRYILLEGLYATKANQLHPSADPFVKEVGDSQLSWLTGMNSVQNGTAIGSPTLSISFIFGIGNFPQQYHSRLLYDSGYKSSSGDEIIGVRGTSLQFLDPVNNEYVYLDGMQNILGKSLGASGNNWRNETQIEPFHVGTIFNNDKSYIPGWISGPYDTVSDQDLIFNYRDNLNTYEFTETTNEIVATAVELFAYLDAGYNNKPQHNGIYVSPQVTQNATLTFITNPASSNIYLNSQFKGMTNSSGIFILQNVGQGNYSFKVNKSEYFAYEKNISVLEGINATIDVNLSLIPVVLQNSSLHVISNADSIQVYLDNLLYGLTNASYEININNLVPGDYNLTLKKTEYLDRDVIISLVSGQNNSIVLNLTNIVQNGTVTITTSPSIADIYVNSSLVGTTNASGNIFLNLNPGIYSIKAAKSNYVPSTILVEIQQSVNKFANVSLDLDNTVSVVSTVTNLDSAAQNNIYGVNYSMYELDNASFYLSLNINDTVAWYIDDIFQQSEPGINSTFYWKPGIFWAPIGPDYWNVRPVNISARLTNINLTWTVGVEDLVNPYFTAIDDSLDVSGTSDTKVHVQTNDKKINFTALNISLKNIESGVIRNFALNRMPDNATGGTNWELSMVNIDYGSNFLVKIYGINNVSGSSGIYELTNERGHYRNFPSQDQPSGSDSPSSDSGNGGGGNGDAGAQSFAPPEIIYVILDKDTVLPNEEQTVTLDAKYLPNGVSRVSALFLPPSGTSIIKELSIIKGKPSYGTWFASFSASTPGLYKLYSIKLWTEDAKDPPTEILISDRSFYIAGENAINEGNLELIYEILSESNVKNGTKVLLTLDAKDKIGVGRISANIKSTGGENYDIELKLSKGSKNYGTWSGEFLASQPGTTYSVASVTISNGKESKTYQIKDRNVYVSQTSRISSLNSITANTISNVQRFSAQWVDALLKRPWLPTAIGFGTVIVMLTLIFFGSRFTKQFSRFRKKN
ncbi:MAG TPA: PEGA domain-containing protein [Candidatus Nanoarchaeia archaeon]|nr:PEGA domain-containing protein [Candidatus Nanoarchaeia archaeon]